MNVCSVGLAFVFLFMPSESHAFFIKRSVVAPIAMTMRDGDFEAKISFDDATSSNRD